MTLRGRRILLVNLSLLIAIALAIFPLPNWAAAVRPDWVALVLIYWCIALPMNMGFSTAFIFGVLLDIATGTLLGQHALGLTIVSYVILKNHSRLRLFPLIQQGVIIMLLLMVKQLVFLWIYGMTHNAPSNMWLYFLPSVISMILWPWLFVFMENIRRRYLNI
ncbi:MAG: rod shape-determining protein MreD [Gammaproteobacteria bacterium]|nr:rod shape-determining protein MreD [Gammaproteobacteria bacterium]